MFDAIMNYIAGAFIVSFIVSFGLSSIILMFVNKREGKK